METYLGLAQAFARRKYCGAFTIEVVTQEDIATSYSLDGKVEAVKKDTGTSVLRFARRTGLAQFLRNSPPRSDTTYRIRGLDLSGLDLHGAKLQGVEIINCNLSRTNLTDATLTGARMTDCTMQRTNFKGADLTNATLQDCDMTGVDFGVRACRYLEMKWCTNPPHIGRGESLQPAYYTHPRYTGPHKIRGLVRKLS